MRLKRETALELMALADGELQGEAKERALRRLDSDVEARKVLATVCDDRRALWLRTAIEDRATSGRADDVADAVLAKLAAAGASPARLDVRGRGLHRPRSPFRTGFGATATLGLAAGVALYFATRQPRGAPVGPGASAGSPAAMAASLLGGVELNEIDAPARDVSLFEISGAPAAAPANPSSPVSLVIWIPDEPGTQ